jgi:predicted Zn-dependent protease
MKRAQLDPKAALLLALLGLSGCATNPVTGRNEVSLVSTQQELQIGRDGFAAVVSEYGKYDDAALSAYVDSVGQRVAHVSHLPSLEWHFTLVDDPAVNAFAMPGGYIYVTRGLLAYMNSEAQLAGVLGHEIGHVTHRHTAEAMTRQQLYGLGFGVLQIAAPGLRPYSSAGQQALGLLFLKYSRQNENEADALGVEYATKAGYDPREIPATYATLKRISEASGSSMPSFLSTHPDPGSREATTTTEANQAAAGKSGLMIRQRDYVRHLEGRVFGRDPREGYFEGRTYYHPTLGFQIDFPEGWKQQDSRASVAAAEPSQQGVVQLSVAQAGDASPESFVQSLLATGKLTQATGRRETIGGYDAWVGYVTAPGDNGPANFDLAFIRSGEQTMYQILGQSAARSDASEQRILETMRSFRALADASRRQALPPRLHLLAAPSTGTLRALLPQLGTQGATPEEVAIVNGVDLDETLQSGKTLKLVRPGRTR